MTSRKRALAFIVAFIAAIVGGGGIYTENYSLVISAFLLLLLLISGLCVVLLRNSATSLERELRILREARASANACSKTTVDIQDRFEQRLVGLVRDASEARESTSTRYFDTKFQSQNGRVLSLESKVDSFTSSMKLMDAKLSSIKESLNDLHDTRVAYLEDSTRDGSAILSRLTSLGREIRDQIVASAGSSTDYNRKLSREIVRSASAEIAQTNELVRAVSKKHLSQTDALRICVDEVSADISKYCKEYNEISTHVSGEPDGLINSSPLCADESARTLERQSLPPSEHVAGGTCDDDFDSRLEIVMTKIVKAHSVLSDKLTKVIWDETRQVDALIQLSKRLSPRWAMPPFGRWSLDARSALHLVEIVEEVRPRTIVELGSGTSSVLLGYLAETSGTKVVSFEHLEEFASRTREMIRHHGLADVVNVIDSPLESLTLNGEEFRWYSNTELPSSARIDILFVDGPPGGECSHSRFPALPMLMDYLADDAVIILDDSDRADETEILEMWETEFPDFTRRHRGISRLGVLSRGVYLEEDK